MKIGIISVNNAHNFGTCMQAFALKRYLESKGNEVNIINFRLEPIEKSYRIIKTLPKNTAASNIKYRLKYLKTVLKKPYLVKRRKNFENFFVKYYNLTPPYKTLKELRNAALDFDIVFAGSDQIWNSSIIKSLNPAFFVDFVGDKTIRATYAASFGNDKIPEEEKSVFQKYFRDLDYISVREQSAKTELAPLTDKEIKVVLDPTLLVERSVYEPLLKKNKYNKEYIYIHVHHYTAKGPELVQVGELISQKTGLPVVHNIIGAEFSNVLGNTVSASPEEVLTSIANAKYVITQSFHATVFSIIYNKNFLTLTRNKYSERLSNLLDNLGLIEHYVTDFQNPPMLEDVPINYEDVHAKLAEQRKGSVEFVEKVLNEKKKKRIPDWFISKDKYTCFGCSACKDVCPVDAIEMKEDEEGFVQPYIDKEKCINCNLCQKKCIYNLKPLNKEFKSRAFIAYNKDENVRLNSTSGGMFPSLYKPILEQGGAVVGVKYDDNLVVTYDIAFSFEDCEAFRFSKYVEPKHNDIFRKVKEVLEQGKPVLFSGSPCKIAGLKNYLGKDYEKLYLVDVICECTSSPVAFAKYIKQRGDQDHVKITGVRFRDKQQGWKKQATTLTMDDGSKNIAAGRWNNYFNAFVSGYLAKQSCYNCEFCGDNRIADVTIGDFWGVDKLVKDLPLEQGISAVKVGSEKGMQLMDSISDSLYLKEVSYEDIYHRNHGWHTDLKPERNMIFEEMKQDGSNMVKILRKYNPRYNKRKK